MRFEEPHRTYASRLLPTERAFSFVGGSRTLVAKEWVEVRRSGTLSPIIFEYLAPLGAVYILAWLFRTGLESR